MAGFLEGRKPRGVDSTEWYRLKQLEQAQNREYSMAEKKNVIANRKITGDSLHSKAYQTASNAQLMNSSIGLWSVIKPLIVGAFMIFLVIGPGSAVLLQILGAIGWYWWVAAIIFGVFMYKSWG